MESTILLSAEKHDKQLVDSTLQRVRKFHKIDNFALVNQYGEIITQKTFKDKILKRE